MHLALGHNHQTAVQNSQALGACKQALEEAYMREQVLDYKHLAQIAVQNNQVLEVVCKQVLVEAVPLHFPQHP